VPNSVNINLPSLQQELVTIVVQLNIHGLQYRHLSSMTQTANFRVSKLHM